MKAYIKNPTFSYPEDMEIILDYLYKHGKVMASDEFIENCYYVFSGTKHCTQWLSLNINSDKEKILAEFADYLAEWEID